MIAFTDFYDFDKLVEIDNFCRVNKKGFIYSGHLGLYGFCFVDFGIDHKINDKDGE